MGCWNGVGGKIENVENPRESMLREMVEETTIEPQKLTFKGFITWSNEEGSYFGGLFLYLAEIPTNYTYETPLKTTEGILDWKEIDWIMHPDNQGVAANISSALYSILNHAGCYNYHSIFAENRLIEQVSSPIDPSLEFDEEKRNQYLKKYIEGSRLNVWNA